MRRILVIALVLGGISASVMTSPRAEIIAIHGLHLALPINMTTFPAELVPLP